MTISNRSLLGVLLAVLVLASGVPAASPSPTAVELLPEIDDRHAAGIAQAKQPVLVFAYADWCGVCHRQGPLVEAVARKYQGKISCYKVDIDRNPGLNVQLLPTLFLRTPDGRVDTKTGLTGRASLEAWVDDALARSRAAPQPAPSGKP